MEELPVELLLEILILSQEDIGLLSYVCTFWREVIKMHFKEIKFNLTNLTDHQIRSLNFNNDRIIIFALQTNSERLLDLSFERIFSFKAIKHYFLHYEYDPTQIIVEKLSQNILFKIYRDEPKLFKHIIKNTQDKIKIRNILSFTDNKQPLLIFELIVYSYKVNNDVSNNLLVQQSKIDKELWNIIPHLLKNDKNAHVYKELTTIPENNIIETLTPINIYEKSCYYTSLLFNKIEEYKKLHNNTDLVSNVFIRYYCNSLKYTS